MRSIQPTLTAELARSVAGGDIAHATPFPISTYRQLVEHVARLAYVNRDYLLFFRGQDKDYQSKAGGTTLYPAIYRGDYLPQRELAYRFELLSLASRMLVDRFTIEKIEGHTDVSRKKYIQWSILQHYEVVDTPLLDLTHSLRVACSFAQLASTDPTCYVYVLGLPYVTHRISIDSEEDIVNVRLLSICPPKALRPYFQEGYLAGTPDVTSDFDSKTEVDFRNRLIAKFAISRGKRFWGDGFEMTPKTALFPLGDQIEALCTDLRAGLSKQMQPGDLGQFVQEWAILEEVALAWARRITERNVSVREAITTLVDRQRVPAEVAHQLDALRRFRNIAVHRPKQVTLSSLADATRRARELRKLLEERGLTND